MKSTVVPAQVTTVEDKVAGSLSLSQLLLLVTPAFIGGGMYALIPPMMGMPVYKMVIAGLVALVFSLLAIRVKGKILLLWLVIMLRYNSRPRYYVFNKNSTYLRDIDPPAEQEAPQPVAATEEPQQAPALRPTVAETIRLEKIVANPKANLRFLTDKKGALRVHFTEVE